MALIRHFVPVAPDDFGVLIFHTWRNKIPDGIHVLRACGGTPPAAPKSVAEAATSDVTLKNARLGFDSFLETCSITNPVVSEGQNGYCRVYINWEVDPSRPGYNAWGEDVYRNFLRGLFNETYATAKIRREGKKISVRFSDKRTEHPTEAKIEFATAKPETAWTPENTIAFARRTPQLQGTVPPTGRPTLHLPKKS